MLAILIALLSPQATPDTTRLKVQPSPAVQYIERREGQALNFDFVVENTGNDPLTLNAVEVTVRDAKVGLVLRRFVDGNGFSPRILTIPNRVWAPGEKKLFFNPFSTFASKHDLATLDYELRFERSADHKDVVHRIRIKPRPYASKTDLVLPVDGLLLVYDGHDFYSHHRRLDFTHPVAQQVGLRMNFGRFAYDFVHIDADGSRTRAVATGNDAYYGFGDNVLAPGAGVVVSAVDVQPDNTAEKDYFDPSKLSADPMSLYGNHVVIDHGNGEFSALGHLKRGSIRVKVGDRIAQGTVVGQVGSSGSSYFPHLHYELRTGSTLNVEGLPSYFRAFERVSGTLSYSLDGDAVDTGDIIRSTRKR